MQFALLAVMAIFLLPGNVGAPAHAQVTSAPEAAAEDSEPSYTKVATISEATQSYTVSMTAYNAVPAQTDGDPFTTASGAYSNPEVVAARSQDLGSELPFGTVVKIERTVADTPRCQFSKVEHLIGYRVIADTMHSRWTKKIDVLFDHTDTVPVGARQVNPSLVLGVCDQVTVTVVGKIDISAIPDTQAELALMFEEPSLALR